MPLFTKNQIINSKNPYQLFSEVTEGHAHYNRNNPYNTLGDVLLDHKEILDQLDPNQQNQLARALILNCPQYAFKTLRYALKALASGNFYEKIAIVHQTKIYILGLLDEKNNKPHITLLEAMPSFNKNKEFASSELEKDAPRIAERLAFLTPSNCVKEVLQQVANTFSQTNFSDLVGSAFSLQQDIQYLLGNNPELFFTSERFDRTICLTFSKLFDSIQGHEAQISSKLKGIPSTATQNTVLQRLELLTTQSNDADPLAIILKSIKKNSSAANNPNSFVATKSPRLTESSNPTLFAPV